MRLKIHCTIPITALVLAACLFFGASALAEPVKPIRLGCAGSFKATPWAMGGLSGIQLAVEEINAAGGVNVGGAKRPFELITVDTRDEEPGVPVSECLLGIEKLILDQKVDVLCGGPTMSEASMATIDLAAKHNIVNYVCMGTWTPSWPKKVGEGIKKYGTSFKATTNVAQVLTQGVEMLESLRKDYGYSSAYTIIQDCLFARAGMGAFTKIAAAKGWKIVGSDAVPMGTSDYSPELIRAKKSGADVLLYWWADITGSILYKQFIDLQIPALPVGFSPATQEHEVYKEMGGKVEYFVFAVGQAGAISSKLPGGVKFQQAFEKKFTRKPFGASAAGYMGPYVVKDAIERANSLKTEDLVATLEKTDYMGISGKIQFDKNHEITYSDDPSKGVVQAWGQWIEGNRVCVWPTTVTDLKIALPPWMGKK